jgi:hypothetical protein
MATILDRVTLDIERHAAASGWDQPPRLFALVETADLVRREPQLAAQLGLGTAEAGGLGGPEGPGGPGGPGGPVGPGGLGGPSGLSPVEQDELPDHATIEEMLGGIAWPPEVLGTALTVERLMVPPEAERDMPQDEDAALQWLAEHPQRQEVRIVVAVLRDGSRSAALRMRAHDDETSVLSGPDLVPGLADALAATLHD